MTPEWSDAINGWLSWLRAGRPSPLTIRQRHWQMTVTARAFAGRSPWDVTPDELAAWLGEQDQWSAASVSSQRAAIRSFYRWAVTSGRARSNPAVDLPKVRVNAGLPRPASDDALARALDGATDQVRLMVLLAVMAGLRCTEIASLRWADIEPGALIVRGKGDKPRRLPLHPKLGAELAAEHARRVTGGAGSGFRYLTGRATWVFPGQARGASGLAPRQVSVILSGALGDGATAHMLRHRFLTRAYQGTHDLRAVQQLAGHASPATTAVYTLIGDEQLTAAVLAAG